MILSAVKQRDVEKRHVTCKQLCNYKDGLTEVKKFIWSGKVQLTLQRLQ